MGVIITQESHRSSTLFGDLLRAHELTGSHPCQSITVSLPRKQVSTRTKREEYCHWLILEGLVGELRLSKPFIHDNHVKMLEQDQVNHPCPGPISNVNLRCRSEDKVHFKGCTACCVDVYEPRRTV